jgi:oligopeptide transport system substrate-binding protein
MSGCDVHSRSQVDRTAMVEKILRGGQHPATAITPPGMSGYTRRSAHPRTSPPPARCLPRLVFPRERDSPRLKCCTTPLRITA